MPANNDQRERRYLYARHETRKLDAKNDSSPGTIEGYAAVFYRRGDRNTEFPLYENRIIERIAPGAFDEIENDDVRCLFDHESRLILGRNVAGTLELSVDQTGLFYRCILPNTTAGRDVAESIDRGDINGSSFQFEVADQEWTENEGEPAIRTLTRLRLFDVGPVTFPAYYGATVGVRSSRAVEDLDQLIQQRNAAQRGARRRRLMRRRFAG